MEDPGSPANWERALVLWVKNSLEGMSRSTECQQYFACVPASPLDLRNHTGEIPLTAAPEPAPSPGTPQAPRQGR